MSDVKQNHNFTEIRTVEIPELNSTATLYKHATGAELLSLVNADENKVFGAAFRTPPADGTGVAHILEHSVLCGSRKYPVKEPFVELLKGSLQTFLNAFTFPDKTCYPVASCNLADFYNLVDVYLDAVFYPLLTPEKLAQEGWHLEGEGAEGPFAFKGVVYNEMKGVYSSPDSVFHEACQQSLFPDMTYGLDSGGNPAEIPNLTFEAFKSFHETFYHPANCRFFFAGDDPVQERLRVLDAYCSEFADVPAPDLSLSAVPLQKPLPAPARVVKRYAADPVAEEQEGEDKRAYLAVNFLLPETTDVETALTLSALEHVLQGLPGSPLRRALIESGLGEDLTGVGLETELRQMYFSTGLKHIREADAEKVEALILGTLARIAEEGVAPAAAEAAVNSLEFALRENNTGRFPRNLNLMLRALTTWLYDGDPVAPLAFDAPLTRLKDRLAAGEQVFEDAIRIHLLENTHRATVFLTPDTGMAQELAEAEKTRVREYIKAVTESGETTVEALLKQAEELKVLQGAPDKDEDLAKLPRLTLADLPRENTEIPTTIRELDGTELHHHPLDTAGIAYLDLAFDASGLPLAAMPFLPLFGRALTEMSTTRRDFAELSMLIARQTGGVEAEPLFMDSFVSPEPVRRMLVRAKATAEKAPELAEILTEVLLETDFSDQERFLRMVLEEKARHAASLVPAGHMVVAARLKARLGGSGMLGELTDGLSQLTWLKRLEKAVTERWSEVQTALESIRAALFARATCLGNLTVEEDAYTAVASHLTSLLQRLPQSAKPLGENALLNELFQGLSEAPGAWEGLGIPAQVNYVGAVYDLHAAGHAYTGGDTVVAKHLRMGHLWDKVRVQGGAYGAFCMLDRVKSSLAFVSYRDPNLGETLDVYRASADYLTKTTFSAEALEQAVIGAIGDLDKHMLPDAAGFTAFARHLVGDDDARRQTMREEILGAGEADFRRLGQALAKALSSEAVSILGNAEGLEQLGLPVTRVL